MKYGSEAKESWKRVARKGRSVRVQGRMEIGNGEKEGVVIVEVVNWERDGVEVMAYIVVELVIGGCLKIST